MKEIKHLLVHEFKMEMRNKHSLSGILVYVVSTVFVCYLSFRRVIDVPTWNALFWIIMLFASINAVAKSFMQQSKGRMLYYYSLVSPQGFILAKIIYNSLLMTGLGLVCALVYGALLGNLVSDPLLFAIAIAIGASGFAATFSLMSAIASRSGNSPTLMAILSFPVIIPFLITLIGLSKNAIDGLNRSASLQEIAILLGIEAIVVALSYILFPYLWRN